LLSKHKRNYFKYSIFTGEFPDVLNPEKSYNILDIFDIDYSRASYSVKKPDGEVVLTDIPDTIINTSCEHIANFEDWYSLIPVGKLMILQTNDYFEIEDHVNCSASLQDFANQTPMAQCLYQGVIDLGKYRRFMRIGVK
jgi:hypothetical protein